MTKDISGREYKIGDYVFCATQGYNHSVSTFLGKVCSVGETTISVVRCVKYALSVEFRKSTIQLPGRDIIVPESVAQSCCPELVAYNVMPKEYKHCDVLGVQYKVGDYVFVAQHAGESSVQTYFAKVVKINPESITVYRDSHWSWRANTMIRSILRVPSRHMIVPKEVALVAEPSLK